MLGADDSGSLLPCFLPTSIYFKREPVTGFCASNLETSSNKGSRGFSFLQTFFAIGSNLRQKLAWLCFPLVTYRSISDCNSLA